MADKIKAQKAGGTERGPRCAGLATFTALVLWASCAGSLAAQNTPDLSGNWQGNVEAGRGFRIILQISQADHGQGDGAAWQGVFYTMGPGGARESEVNSLAFDGMALRFVIPPDGSFAGKMSADSKSITGSLKQGEASYALVLARASGDSAWALPKPTDHMPPDATPEFEVATIKPTDPGWGNKGFHSNGRRISCDNETVGDIISFAYGLHVRQIVDGPGWLGTDRYDVDGVPDLIGEPNTNQMKDMYRGILSSRFNLAFHHETRPLSVYALHIGKDGPKLSKSLGDPKGQSDTTFTEWNSQAITLKATNVTMADFVWVMGMVSDRPAADQTGLAGRFDFRLRWAPEGAQPSDPNAPPGLFTAVQEQLGLKFEATKAPVDVLVIDHIDRPSPN